MSTVVETIDLASGSLGADLIPADELADCAETAAARDGRAIFSYGSGGGYTPLRELIGEWFGVAPSRVLITNGWLHGLTLIAEQVIGARTATSRNVVLESPLDERVAGVFLRAGASILSVSVDDEGFAVNELEQMLVQYTLPALVFTVSVFHNPTGWSMSPARRRRLLDITSAQYRMRSAEILVVEDGSYALTRFEGEPSPGLHDLSRGQTVYTSSFSATIAPGLRVGFVIAPEQLSERLERAATDSYITPVLLGQATVHEFVTRGAFDRQLEHLRTELRRRRDAMASALERHLPDATWSSPQGGFFTWVRLPGYPDGREIVKRATGVAALAGTSFGAPSDYLRLSYAAADVDEIESGIACLAAAI